MVTRKRVNLTLSDPDFDRLSELATREGKTPSTFAVDVIKATLYGAAYPASPAGRKSAVRPGSAPVDLSEEPSPEDELFPVKAAERPLSRQERRALERGQAKKALGVMRKRF